MKIAMGKHLEVERAARDFVHNNFLETSNMHWNIIFPSSPPDCSSWKKKAFPNPPDIKAVVMKLLRVPFSTILNTMGVTTVTFEGKTDNFIATHKILSTSTFGWQEWFITQETVL